MIKLTAAEAYSLNDMSIGAREPLFEGMTPYVHSGFGPESLISHLSNEILRRAYVWRGRFAVFAVPKKGRLISCGPNQRK